MATTGLAGLLLAWLREKTGSVLLPVLLHNYGNAVFMLI
nr:CPBP family glutamic-type intramembrane protease [Brevundimonas sp.]